MSTQPIKLFERFQDFSFCPLDAELHGKAKTITIVENPNADGSVVMIIRCANISFESLHSMVSSICEQASETRTILLGCQISWKEALLLTTLGVHAISAGNPGPTQLNRMIEAAQSGYIYICSRIQNSDTSKRSDSKDSVGIATPTAREQEVLALVIRGHRNREIATMLNLSRETVKTHVKHLLEKFNVSDRTNLAIAAFDHTNNSRLSA